MLCSLKAHWGSLLIQKAPCCKHFSFTSPASSTFWKLSKNTNESKTSQQFRRVYASVCAFLFFVALHHPGSAAEQFPFLSLLLAASSAGHPHQEHCDSQVTHAAAMWVGTLPCPAPKDTAFYGVFRVEVVAVRSTLLLVLHQPRRAELTHPVLQDQNEEPVHIPSGLHRFLHLQDLPTVLRVHQRLPPAPRGSSTAPLAGSRHAASRHAAPPSSRPAVRAAQGR